MSEKLLFDLININDYKSTRHIFLSRNESSGTSIVDPQLIQLIEIEEKGIKLKMPKNSCQKGHNLTIFIFEYKNNFEPVKIPTEGKVKGSFDCIGKVVNIDIIENETYSIVEIEFSQIDEKPWMDLVKKYKSINDKIRNISAMGKN